MERETIINIIFGVLVFIIIILIGFFIIMNIPIQLEQAFSDYCSEQNETIYYPVNLDCLIGHQYCNIVCTNEVNMDEWLDNVTWVNRVIGRF